MASKERFGRPKWMGVLGFLLIVASAAMLGSWESGEPGEQGVEMAAAEYLRFAGAANACERNQVDFTPAVRSLHGALLARARAELAEPNLDATRAEALARSKKALEGLSGMGEGEMVLSDPELSALSRDSQSARERCELISEELAARLAQEREWLKARAGA